MGKPLHLLYVEACPFMNPHPLLSLLGVNSCEYTDTTTTAITTHCHSPQAASKAGPSHKPPSSMARGASHVPQWGFFSVFQDGNGFFKVSSPCLITGVGMRSYPKHRQVPNTMAPPADDSKIQSEGHLYFSENKGTTVVKRSDMLI